MMLITLHESISRENVKVPELTMCLDVRNATALRLNASNRLSAFLSRVQPRYALSLETLSGEDKYHGYMKLHLPVIQVLAYFP